MIQLVVKVGLIKMDLQGVVLKEKLPFLFDIEEKSASGCLRNKTSHNTAHTIPKKPKTTNIDLQLSWLIKQVTKGAPMMEAKGIPNRPKAAALECQRLGIQSVTVRTKAGK